MRNRRGASRCRFTLLLTHSRQDPKREQLNLRTLRAEGVAAIIFTSGLAEMNEYRRVLKAGIQLVAMSCFPPNLKVDLVTIANTEGAPSAVSHLLSLGHRRIGLIDGPAWISTTRERLSGYEQAFAAADLPVPRDLVLNAD